MYRLITVHPVTYQSVAWRGMDAAVFVRRHICTYITPPWTIEVTLLDYTKRHNIPFRSHIDIIKKRQFTL